MMNDLILVTGSEGLVGSRFVEVSKFRTKLHYPRQIELDITNKSELEAVLSSFDFQAIIHFAAYTDVTKAEEERENKGGLCWQINVEGTRNLVDAVKPYNDRIHFIHISTDMVFPGSKNDRGPYSEDHNLKGDLSELTWYGYTKSQAEKTVLETLGDKATILRLIYPVRAEFDQKLDYIRKPLSLFDQGKLYPLFSDQQISISFIDEISQVLDILIEKGLYGIFHAASADTTTPFKLISYVLEKTRGAKNAVKAIKVDNFLKDNNLPSYRYPKFGGLYVDISQKLLGVKFRTWREIVDALVEQGLGHP